MTTRPTQLSQDVARAMNLLAHPMGSWAAASALGLGMATQAWGLWFGAVAGAMENARKGGGELASAQPDEETVAAVKARAAAVTLMAEAQSLARKSAASRPRRAVAGTPVKSAKPKAEAPLARAEAAQATLTPAAASKPAKVDDLKMISGIGPKLEQVLNGMGIWTYSQIAAWTTEQAASVDDRLGFAGRIGRDDWIGQAKALAGAAGR